MTNTYKTIYSGPQIQDFKVRNAIDALKTNVDFLKDLVSLGAQPVAAGTYPTSSTSYSTVPSLATDFVALIGALRTAGLMRS